MRISSLLFALLLLVSISHTNTSAQEATPTPINPSLNLPAGYTWFYRAETDTLYGLSDVATNWNAANGFCIQLGGHLVSINDKEEDDWIFDTINPDQVWIGLTQSGGEWFWTTSEPILYTHWTSGLDETGEPRYAYLKASEHG